MNRDYLRSRGLEQSVNGPRASRRDQGIAVLAAATLVGLTVCPGCKRHGPAPAASAHAAESASAVASALAVASATPGVAQRCAPAKGDGEHLLLGLGAPADTDDDEAIDAPFAPEIGTATALKDAFAVGVLEPRGKTTNAGLLVVGGSLSVGKKIDLGAVHGDVLAPRPIASGASLVVAVPDGAPHGTLLRLARVDDLLGAARVTWGAEVLEGSDDSDAFAIESGQKSILLAWDDWDPKAGHSIVRTVAMMQGDVAKAPPPSVVSGEHDDAEAPALAPRPGGFWIAWIANAKRAPDHKEKHEAQDPAETAELEMGPRYLMVEPLDDGGKPAGAKVAATAKDGHVTGFDLGSARDGGLILTWRDDRAAPGTAGGSVRAALVRPDGAIEPRVVTDDDVGPGAPALVVDDAPAADASAWLTIANDADALRLVALDADGRPLDELAVEPNLGMASALAARSGRVVVSRPAGKGLEIQVMQCAKGNRPEGSATPN